MKRDGEPFKTKKSVRMYPGEMERISLRADMLEDVSVLSVEVEEVQEG